MKSQQILFEAIGTSWQIDLYEKSPIDLKKLHEDILVVTEDFDKSYSRFRQDSFITHVSKAAGKYSLPETAQPMLDLYQTLEKLTKGTMTPLIGILMEDTGYDASYSLRPRELRPVPRWENSLVYEYPHLITKQPVLLDFGALGKGYLIDLIGSLLQKNHLSSFCIDGGGDMLYRTRTEKPLLVGLENPLDTSQVIGKISLHNQSICASAGNRRKWRNFHHILNPHTQQSVNSALATWVVAETAVVADALSTALFFTDPEILLTQFSFAYLIMYPDSSIKKSADFLAQLHYTDSDI